MDYRSSTSRYILTVLAIILLITTFILVGLNAFDIQGRFMTGRSYEDGYRAAREKFVALCPILGTEALSIAGTVVSIQGDAFILRQSSLATDEAVDGVPDNRSIVIPEGVKIIRYVQSVADQERGDPTSPAGIALPIRLHEQEMHISDLQVGQRVTVMSDSDIRESKTITAKSVIVQ